MRAARSAAQIADKPRHFSAGFVFAWWSKAIELRGLFLQAFGASGAAAERAIFFMFCAAAAIRH